MTHQPVQRAPQMAESGQATVEDALIVRVFREALGFVKVTYQQGERAVAVVEVILVVHHRVTLCSSDISLGCQLDCVGLRVRVRFPD